MKIIIFLNAKNVDILKRITAKNICNYFNFIQIRMASLGSHRDVPLICLSVYLENGNIFILNSYKTKIMKKDT